MGSPEDLIFKMHGAQGGSQVQIFEFKNHFNKIIEILLIVLFPNLEYPNAF